MSARSGNLRTHLLPPTHWNRNGRHFRDPRRRSDVRKPVAGRPARRTATLGSGQSLTRLRSRVSATTRAASPFNDHRYGAAAPWGSADYARASPQFTMAAAILVFALDDMVWTETRRPIWANAVLGAALAYFLIAVAVRLVK